MWKIVIFILFSSLSANIGQKTFLPEKFRIKFSKELQSILKKKKKSKGILTYQYPGKVRIEQESPFKTIYVSNGKKAWLYSAPFDPQKEKGEVTILNPQKLPLVKVLDELRRGPTSNEIYSVKKEGQNFILNFNEQSQKKYQVEHVKIEMKSPAATRFDQVKTLTVKSKSITERYELVEIALSPILPPTYFDFQITENMKVTEGI